jgi:hypothetical protein
MTNTRLSLSMPLLLMALWLPSHTALAEKIYRWVDEDGQVHFSSQPRHGIDQDRYDIKFDKVEAPQPGSSEIDKTQESDSSVSMVSEEKARELCENAQEIKEQISDPSLYFRQADGSVRPLTDEERKSKLETANQRIKDYCR